MRALTEKELTTWLKGALVDGQQINVAVKLYRVLWTQLKTQVDDRTINVHELMKALTKVANLQANAITKYIKEGE